MNDWSIIECFNPADETVNFGTRNLFDGDNLYEVSTLSVLTNSNVQAKTTTVKAVIQNTQLLFSINNTFRIFENTSCTSICFHIKFTSLIDTFCLSSSGQYLLICLRNAEIHCFDLFCESEEQLVYSKSIEENMNLEQQYFVEVFDEKNSTSPTFLLILTNGKVFRAGCVIPDESCTESPELKNFLHFFSEILVDAECFIKISSLNKNILLLETCSSIILYDLETSERAVDELMGIKKLFPCAGQTYLALNDMGQLLLICANTLSVMELIELETLFQDVTFINNSRILGLTFEDDEENCFLHLLEYPGFSLIFSVKVVNEIFIIRPESVYDDFMYISHVHTSETSQLRFQVVTESVPKKMLERLLRKRKIDDAEQFAQRFKLDTGPLKEAKADIIVEKLKCNNADIDSLLIILDDINDSLFKLECCNNVLQYCDSFNSVKKILDYGCKIINHEKEVTNRLFLKSRDDLVESVLKFNIFTLLCTQGHNYVNEDWRRFSTCNLNEEFVSQLKLGHIDNCLLVYNHLSAEDVCRLGTNNIQNFLNKLDVLPQDQCLSYLRNFVQTTLKFLPDSITIFSKWLLKRVFNIESTEKKHFPMVAIKFVEKMVQILKIETSDMNSPYSPKFNSSTDIKNLLEALQMLETLNDKFRIVMNLKDYLEGPQNVVKILLNSLVNTKCNHPLQDFLRNFMVKNGLNPDKELSNTIKILLYNNNSHEFNIKLMLRILNCIDSLETKLETILQILKILNVPWPSGIKEIATSFLKFTHPIVGKITKEIENEQMYLVLRKKQYKLPKLSLIHLDDLQFAINRIIYCNEDTMIEDTYHLCSSSHDKHEANKLLISYFIRRGNFEEVCQILDRSLPDEILLCCEYIIVGINNVLNSKFTTSELRNNYAFIMNSIFKRMKENSPIWDSLYYDDLFYNLKSVYKLNQSFNLNVTSNDVIHNKEDIQLKVINNMLDNLKNGSYDITKCFEEGEKLSCHLKLDKNVILVKLCKTSENFELILELGKDAFKYETKAKTLCLFTKLLLANIGNIKRDVQLFTEALAVAKQLMQKALFNCTISDSDVNTIFNWAHSSCSLLECHENSFREQPSSSPTMIAFKAIRDIFIGCIRLLGNVFMHPNVPVNELMFDSNCSVLEVLLSKEIENISNAIDNLIKDGYVLTALKLLITLKQNMIYYKADDAEVFSCLDEPFKKCILKLLYNTFSLRYIDEQFAFDLLILLDSKESIPFVKQQIHQFKRNVYKYEVGAILLSKLLNYYNINGGKNTCKQIILQAKWWKRIKNCQVPYDDFFKNLIPSILIYELIKLNHLDTVSLNEYCTDFKLNHRSHYLFYLTQILTNWKPIYEVTIDICGKRNLKMKNTAKEISNKCKEVITIVNDDKTVINVLDNLWGKINFYHYEVFECILNLITFLDAEINNRNKTDLLSFLKNYDRVNTPNQNELEQWCSLFPCALNIDSLSEWRLPYTERLFSTDIWNIIRPEINLNTYETWFLVVDFLDQNLRVDDICSYVVKAVVENNVLQANNSNNWILYPKFDGLFEEIDKCVQNISNLELSVSVMNYLMSNTPKGADLVTAATLCYKYAQKYKEEFQDSSKANVFKKIEIKYYNFSAMHILYQNQLADEEYLKLVRPPFDSLINALYMDSRIIIQNDYIFAHFPNINKAVDQLAELCDIDIQDKRETLLSIWLLDTIFDANDTIRTIEPSMCENNLKRAVYLCKSGNIEHWESYLLKIGLQNQNEDMNIKSKALQCFCAITDRHSWRFKTVAQDFDKFVEHVDKVILLSNLIYLGFNLDISTLDESDKYNLLKQLELRADNSICVTTMSSICITYKIYDIVYWELIINSMVKLEMIKDLKQCLNFLNKNVSYSTQQCYINAWQCIINNLFKINSNNYDEITKICEENLYIIQSCPILLSIDLTQAINHCIQLKLPKFATELNKYTKTKANEEI